MKRPGVLTLIGLGLFLSLACECVVAQPPPSRPGGINPITSPAYSPYLNLRRRGGNPAQNYYGLVRPELQFRAATGALQQEVANSQLAIADLEAGATVPATGHATHFLNTAHYFFNRGGQAPGNRAPSSVAPPPPSRYGPPALRW